MQYQTFYVDIDMSNSDARAHHSVSERSQRAFPNPSLPKSGQEARDDDDQNDDLKAIGAPTDPLATAHRRDSPLDLQILELRSKNPVILYNDQVYSCTWHDLIGTNMFFSQHNESLQPEPMTTDGNTDLLGTSRIKLVARQAKLQPKQGPEESRAAENEELMKPAKGSGLGALRSTKPKINVDMRKQAKFLEELMEVKQAKGDVDNVRTIRKRDHGSVAEGEHHVKRRKEQPLGPERAGLENEIQHLNRLTLRCDPNALERLGEIYGLLDDDEPNVAAAQQ